MQPDGVIFYLIVKTMNELMIEIWFIEKSVPKILITFVRLDWSWYVKIYKAMNC